MHGRTDGQTFFEKVFFCLPDQEYLDYFSNFTPILTKVGIPLFHSILEIDIKKEKRLFNKHRHAKALKLLGTRCCSLYTSITPPGVDIETQFKLKLGRTSTLTMLSFVLRFRQCTIHVQFYL